MSLQRKVWDLIAKLGRATADDLVGDLTGYSRDQIRKSLHNLRDSGRLTCNGYARRTGEGSGGISLLSSYSIAERAEFPADPTPIKSKVLDALRKAGPSTVEQLVTFIGDMNKTQVQNAMERIRREGMAELVQKGRGGKNSSLGIWAAREVDEGEKAPAKHRQAGPSKPVIASVWQLGSGPVKVPAWQQPVREFRLLGSWE